MDLYPDDGPLPGIEGHVIHDSTMDPDETFLTESAGFDVHPAQLLNPRLDSNDPVVLLEKLGVSDPEDDKLSGCSFTASALCNLIPKDAHLPDLIIHHGKPVPEYDNSDLMPGMFPTLFPFGIGGFEDKSHQSSISFSQQAQYCFNISERIFRYHQSFMFIVLNMIQRCLSHLHTHFTVCKSRFQLVAEKLVAVSPSVLLKLAHHLEHEGNYGILGSEEKGALDLLKEVKTISAKIPGSQAAKILVCTEICSYFRHFGLPLIFFTFNPSAAKNPIFQVMYGDTSVDLSAHFPDMVPSTERALCLAKDPVAAADFFDFCVTCCFKYLFGWDYTSESSTEDGGILGHLKAFYGTTEFTQRGDLHGHFLLWLDGGVNPDVIHERLKNDPQYQVQFFEFFDDIIHHHLPDIEVEVNPKFEPQMERPPLPPSYDTDCHIKMLNEWDSVFITEIKKCGEALQCHHHQKVCEKYGNEGKCHFLFPHEIVEASYYDPETNSIVLMCCDSTINYFNPYILVFC